MERRGGGRHLLPRSIAGMARKSTKKTVQKRLFASPSSSTRDAANDENLPPPEEEEEREGREERQQEEEEEERMEDHGGERSNFKTLYEKIFTQWIVSS